MKPGTKRLLVGSGLLLGVAALGLVALGVFYVPAAGWSTNDVTTGEHPGYPDLQARRYDMPVSEVAAYAAAAIAKLPRWKVVAADREKGVVTAEVTTFPIAFTDDVTVTVTPDAPDQNTPASLSAPIPASARATWGKTPAISAPFSPKWTNASPPPRSFQIVFRGSSMIFKQKTKEIIRQSASAMSLLLLALLLQVAEAQAPVDPPGTYTTSWLGNTFMDKKGMKNVTEELADLCLSPDGKIFTAGYAESGGGGASYLASNGSFAARFDRFESGFGDPVKAVAADSDSVFWGTPGKGFLRSRHGGGGAGSYTTFLAGKVITGLFVNRGKLYISNFSEGKIHVYNIATMTEDRRWSCKNPTRLTVDKLGNVWVVRWNSASIQKPQEGSIWWGDKVVSFSSTGVPVAEITDFDKPLAVAVNNRGQLLVGGLNQHSQVWIYKISGAPSKVGAFGAQGGIFAGTAGAFTRSAKLHWIKAIAVDASDNIYTGCTYGTFWGDCIEKFNPGGALQWRVFAGTSLDCAGIDPDNDTEVYSKYHHYSLDYSKTAPGTEWSLKGFTVNRFKYPNDPRVDANSDVGERSLGAGAWRIGGKLFVGRSSQNGYRFELYRQDTSANGEVLTPSFRMGAGGDANNHFYNPHTKAWMDKPKKDNLYNQYWNIARNGDLFTIGDPQTIIQYKYGGLDANSNPIWDASTAITSVVSEFKPVRRLVYDSDTDVMYMAGDVKDQNWGSFLRVKKFPGLVYP